MGKDSMLETAACLKRSEPASHAAAKRRQMHRDALHDAIAGYQRTLLTSIAEKEAAEKELS